MFYSFFLFLPSEWEHIVILYYFAFCHLRWEPLSLDNYQGKHARILEYPIRCRFLMVKPQLKTISHKTYVTWCFPKQLWYDKLVPGREVPRTKEANPRQPEANSGCFSRSKPAKPWQCARLFLFLHMLNWNKTWWNISYFDALFSLFVCLIKVILQWSSFFQRHCQVGLSVLESYWVKSVRTATGLDLQPA